MLEIEGGLIQPMLLDAYARTRCATVEDVVYIRYVGCGCGWLVVWLFVFSEQILFIFLFLFLTLSSSFFLFPS